MTDDELRLDLESLRASVHELYEPRSATTRSLNNSREMCRKPRAMYRRTRSTSVSSRKSRKPR